MKSGAISCSSSAVSVRVQHGQCEDPRVAIRRGLFRARGKAGAPRCGSACEATPIISSTSQKRRSHEETTCIRDRYCAAGLGAHALRSRNESQRRDRRREKRRGPGALHTRAAVGWHVQGRRRKKHGRHARQHPCSRQGRRPHPRRILMAGYSGTPLAKKLGIKPGSTLLLDGAPDDYPTKEAAVARAISDHVDIGHVVTKNAAELAAKLRKLRDRIRDDTTVWVSWPKKSSKVPTDITEDVIRAIALPLGFVDVKVCAVDDIWSGLKLVIRRELRHQ